MPDSASLRVSVSTWDNISSTPSSSLIRVVVLLELGSPVGGSIVSELGGAVAVELGGSDLRVRGAVDVERGGPVCGVVGPKKKNKSINFHEFFILEHYVFH